MEANMEEPEYILGLLGIMTELVRHCDCCMSHVSKDKLFTAFHESGLPNTCIRILKKFGTSAQPAQLHSVLLPIYLTCSHPTTLCWLQKNHKAISYFHKIYHKAPIPALHSYPNETHLQLVQRSTSEFQTMMSQLQRGEQIYVEKDNAGSGKKRKNAKHYVESDSNKSGNKCQFRAQDTQRKLHIVSEDYSGQNKVIKSKRNARKFMDEPSFRGQTDNFQISNYRKQSTIELSESKSQLKWNDEYKECCSLFGVTDCDRCKNSEEHSDSLWDANPNEPSGEAQTAIKSIKQNQYSKLIQILDDLEKIFKGIIGMYEVFWQRKYQEGYIEARGSIEDFQKLMKILPQMECYYWSEVTNKWKNLVEQFKLRWSNEPDKCRMLLSNLREFLIVLSDDVSKRYEEMNEIDLSCYAYESHFLDSMFLQPTETSKCIDNMNIETDISSIATEPTIELNSMNFIGWDMSSVDVEETWLTTNQYLRSTGNNSIMAPDNHSSSNANHMEETTEFVCDICRDHSLVTCSKMKYTNELTNLRQIRMEKFRAGLSTPQIIVSNTDGREMYEISYGGSFGPVYLGLDIYTSQPVAVKIVSKKDTATSQIVVNSLTSSMRTLINLHSSNILSYSHFIEIQNQYILATPLCERNLGEYILVMKKAGRFNSSLTDSMVSQIINGLHYLHSQNPSIVHGNLKPSNVLVDVSGNLRLADFGTHEILYFYNSPQTTSIIWWAQETYQHYQANNKQLVVARESDIQVAGMLIHYIITGGIHPYGRMPKEILYSLVAGKPTIVIENEETLDLVTWMLTHDYKQRPTTQMLLGHVFMWDKKKRWQFVLTCAGVSTEKEVMITLPIAQFHACLDKYAQDYKVHTKWVKLIKNELWGKVPTRLTYSDTISGLLQLLRDTYPTSSSWFLSVFPSMPLTLIRLLEHSQWLNHNDLSPFVTV